MRNLILVFMVCVSTYIMAQDFTILPPVTSCNKSSVSWFFQRKGFIGYIVCCLPHDAICAAASGNDKKIKL